MADIVIRSPISAAGASAQTSVMSKKGAEALSLLESAHFVCTPLAAVLVSTISFYILPENN